MNNNNKYLKRCISNIKDAYYYINYNDLNDDEIKEIKNNLNNTVTLLNSILNESYNKEYKNYIIGFIKNRYDCYEYDEIKNIKLTLLTNILLSYYNDLINYNDFNFNIINDINEFITVYYDVNSIKNEYLKGAINYDILINDLLINNKILAVNKDLYGGFNVVSNINDVIKHTIFIFNGGLYI